MRRLFPLLLALVLAGCGGAQTASSDPEAPTPADLAADAVAALGEAGSAHYVLDVKGRGNGEGASDFGLRAEGDASKDAVSAKGTVTFAGASFTGQVLASRDELFIGFMGRWYGDRDFGLDGADDELPSPAQVREYFDRVFTGIVGAGPELEGGATWRFTGKLNPEGFADLTEKFDHEDLTERQRELLRTIAEKTHFVLDVGRDDDLPRHLEFRLELSLDDLAEIGDGLDSSAVEDLLELDVDATLDLTDFGKEVDFEPPADYLPLDELLEKLFSGLG